jgi:hypothetical protein
MQFAKIEVSSGTTQAVRRVERSLNWVLRGADAAFERLRLGGRRARYDDLRYEFFGGAGDDLRKKQYEKSLRLLWKAEEHAPQLGFRDCSAAEKQLRELGLGSLDADERRELERLSSAEFKALLDREYTPREQQALVSLLSAIGHGEAYAWLTSAELLADVKSTGARAALSMQVMEEAKHFLVLRELVRAFRLPIPRLSAPEYLLLERVLKAKGLEKLFGMNVVVEGIALGLFGMLSHLPGMEILRLFHLDESRHGAFPSNYFREFPLSMRERKSPLRRLSRLGMLVPALLLIPTLEDDMAELGIDAFDFGGAIVRKIAQLAERNGFELPFPNADMLEGTNGVLNAYCAIARPGHQTKRFIDQETTRGERELSIEGEVFLGRRADPNAERIQPARRKPALSATSRTTASTES